MSQEGYQALSEAVVGPRRASGREVEPEHLLVVRLPVLHGGDELGDEERAVRDVTHVVGFGPEAVGELQASEFGVDPDAPLEEEALALLICELLRHPLAQHPSLLAKRLETVS